MKNNFLKAIAGGIAIALTVSSQAVPIGGANSVSGHSLAARASAQAPGRGSNVKHTQGGPLSAVVPEIAYFKIRPVNVFEDPADRADIGTPKTPPHPSLAPAIKSVRTVLIGSVHTHGPTPATTAFDDVTTTPASPPVDNAVYRSPASTPMGSVPDGGYTALLLGAGLACLALMKRKLTFRLP
jgi:hypothetical protein